MPKEARAETSVHIGDVIGPISQWARQPRRCRRAGRDQAMTPPCLVAMSFAERTARSSSGISRASKAGWRLPSASRSKATRTINSVGVATGRTLDPRNRWCPQTRCQETLPERSSYWHRFAIPGRLASLVRKSALGHVWTALRWQGLFGSFREAGRCGHVFDLLMRHA